MGARADGFDDPNSTTQARTSVLTINFWTVLRPS